jgi:hypothetical protein
MALVCETCGKKIIVKDEKRMILKDHIECRVCSGKRTMIKTYGSYENALTVINKKRQATCKKHYGVTNPSQSAAIKERKEQTSIANYGVKYHLQSKESYDQLKKNNLENFGVEHTFQRDDVKQKCADAGNALRSKDAREKYQKTCRERYGVDNSAKSKQAREKEKTTFALKTDEEWSQIAQKRSKKYIIDGMKLDSEWEVRVYNYFKSKGCSVSRGPIARLSNGRRFEIDFEIDGKLYEVKSSYYCRVQRNAKEKKEYCREHNVVLVSDAPIEGIEFIDISSLK